MAYPGAYGHTMPLVPDPKKRGKAGSGFVADAPPGVYPGAALPYGYGGVPPQAPAASAQPYGYGGAPPQAPAQPYGYGGVPAAQAYAYGPTPYGYAPPQQPPQQPAPPVQIQAQPYWYGPPPPKPATQPLLSVLSAPAFEALLHRVGLQAQVTDKEKEVTTALPPGTLVYCLQAMQLVEALPTAASQENMAVWLHAGHLADPLNFGEVLSGLAHSTSRVVVLRRVNGATPSESAHTHVPGALASPAARPPVAQSYPQPAPSYSAPLVAAPPTRVALDGPTFVALTQRVSQASFARDKMGVVRDALARGAFFSGEQAKTLVALFTHKSDQEDAAVLVVPALVLPSDLAVVLSGLAFRSSVDVVQSRLA